MDTTYDFLDLLELDEGAEERDIRRAYARKLKRIDQEADPDAFQALRTAYEVALDWARWKLAQGTESAAQPDAPSPPAAVDAAVQEEPPAAQEPEPPDAMRLGGEVFGRLGNSAKALQEAGTLGDVAAWRAAIEARFVDEELVNIDARIYFEAFVASMLANGWRPGHEALFVAAREAFAWDGDRRRLWQLGQAGRFLDQAIEERQVFEALPAEEQARMRDLARMLRQAELPTKRRVQAAMPDTERMLARFPALMAVVTDMDNVERWRTVYRESGGAPVSFEVQDTIPVSAEPKRTFTNWQGIILFLVLSAVLRALFNHSGGNDQGFMPPAPNIAQAVPQVVLDQVVPPVRYAPPPGTDVRKLETVFKVFTNDDHEVERVQNWLTSGEPGFDKAVGDALRAAKPFPPGTPINFELRYTGDMVRIIPPSAGGDAQADAAAPPRRIAPPARTPTMAPIPDETLRTHIPPIRFTPGRVSKEGKYTGRYRATLDADGRVKEVHTVKPSGDILLDLAVENAVREAKPFPGGARTLEFTYSTTVFRKPQQQPPQQNDAGQDDPAAAPGAETQ